MSSELDRLISTYISSVSTKFSHIETSEIGYRTDFELLLKAIFESIKVSRFDHDAKAKEGNKPDFVVLKYDIPILYIETKNIGISLDKIEKSEQMARYYGYANLVLTDYLEFRFYRNGIRYEEPIKIGEFDIRNRTITPRSENFEHFTTSLLDFTQSHKEPIKSGKHLSQIMGGKAKRIRDNIRQFLGNESDKNNELLKVYETIKKLLLHDLSLNDFADMYAQTLVYGLFVARYYDKSTNNFSRQEARDLIPTSNPFLRHFFDHIVGPDFDKRLEYIVDELCEVFAHADVQQLMRQYFKTDLWGKEHVGPDPVIHFYEDFLKEYDPVLRKKMGAFYTPQPVVRFIVKAVDYLLQKDFGLAGGLSDTTKTADGIHKVQVLDPAAGTGTFISGVIREIYEKLLKNGQKGRWPTYVHHDLLPRIFGFELMMAPYTIAHLKLSMAFKETGFWNFHRRLGIYLTNSLEETGNQGGLFAGFGLAESIADESKEASIIKNNKPIMVVVGNPPYSVSSSNKGEWITNLTKVYKENLNERNIQPLSDDYIKFIRFAEHFIEKSGNGIVAMITNNSFLDGIIHRQMRKHLLETFDDIYILDLHGSSKKKEFAPDGGKEENIFDIQQGVSISILVKNVNNNKLATLHHLDIFGSRVRKFEYLDKHNLGEVKWKTLEYDSPHYFFVPKDFKLVEKYNKGFSISDIFNTYSSGATSAKDHLLIKFSHAEINELRESFNYKTNEDIAQKYNVDKIQVDEVKNDLTNIIEDSTEILYRPFDIRQTLYSLRSGGVFSRPRSKVMQHMLKGNIGFIAKRGFDQIQSPVCFISKYLIDRRAWSRPGMLGAEQIFPLYLYSPNGEKIPNLNGEIVKQIEKIVDRVIPEDIFDYMYAVLHSRAYHEKYVNFIKIDFPRIPYPKDKQIYEKLLELGRELRELHLLESPKLNNFITTYPEPGSDTVEKAPVYRDGNVDINENQYFGNVPEIAWNFYIGGYQPAQKWLKDRKGRTLTSEDIEHYQKIIVALMETYRIMKEINKKAKNL